VVGLVMLAQPYVLRAFLPGEGAALPIAAHINTIVLWGFVPFGMAFIFNGVIRATGTVWPPLLAMILALWGVRVPFAALLEPKLGADAIWAAFPLGAVVMVTLAAGYYTWGGWRTARILPTAPSEEEPAGA